jgi:hypothetical protein
MALRRLSPLCSVSWRTSRTVRHDGQHRCPYARVFFTSAPRSYHAPQQVGEVVTRLGPSQRFPGLRGVFLTAPVKKFHHIEVLPAAASATSELTSSLPSATPPARGESPHAISGDDFDSAGTVGEASRTVNGSVVTHAPPLVLNLAFAPRHHISLRRFLALRHMFSSSVYLHAATERGWYLIAPSSAAPLCADVAGLERWVRRHHRRYLKPEHNTSSSPRVAGGEKCTSAHLSGVSPREARLAKYAELAKLEAALDNGEELTEAQLRVLANEERRTATDLEKARDSGEEGSDDDDEEGDKDEADDEKDNGMSADSTASPVVSDAAPLRSIPPLITEEHLFEVNDGVWWPMPPSDDLASPDYWKDHRQRMTLYESTGDTDAAAQREALLTTIRSDPRARSCTEQALHAAAEELFQTLKHKANVVLSVDSDTGLLSLVPLQDLQAGEELLLHYGREWWTGRLLSSLLLAVSEEEMHQIRWIEQLFGHEADKNELFPLIVPAHQRRRRSATKSLTSHTSRDPSLGASARAGALSDSDGRPAGSDAQSAEPVSAGQQRGRLVLYNTVTRKRATDAAVLAYAVRRSCVHQGFFDRLVLGSPAQGAPPVFHLSEPDVEVPMRVLRGVLLASLRGVQEGDAANTDAASGADAVHAVSDGPQRANTDEVQEGHRCIRHTGSDDEDGDDGVFSV